jgi:Flp pilus assembly protein TadG
MRESIQRKRRGDALVEFTLTAVPILLLGVSILEMSLVSWEFHSMAYAVEVAARYASVHGRDCTKNGNACTITVGNVASVISAQAPQLSSSLLNVTLTTHASTVTCNPLNTCFGNAAQFPNSTDNGLGLDVTVAATYPVTTPLPIFWAGSASAGTVRLGATSRQNIVF